MSASKASRPVPSFALDCHLGRLSRYLRMLGFDCWWRPTCADRELAAVAASEHRILLTRDRGLINDFPGARSRWIAAIKPREQLLEIAANYPLLDHTAPLSRCLECNTLLKTMRLEDLPAHVPEMTRRVFDEFYLCPDCQRVYWKGSHYEHMLKFVHEVTTEMSQPQT